MGGDVDAAKIHSDAAKVHVAGFLAKSMPYMFGGRTRRYIKVLYSFVVNTTGHKNTFANINVELSFHCEMAHRITWGQSRITVTC